MVRAWSAASLVAAVSSLLVKMATKAPPFVVSSSVVAARDTARYHDSFLDDDGCFVGDGKRKCDGDSRRAAMSTQ